MTKTFNGHPITRIEKPIRTFGLVKFYEQTKVPKRVADLLNELEVGYYEIKGKEFEVREIPLMHSENKEILFLHGNNYINMYIEFKKENEEINHELMGLIDNHEKYDESDCRHCGDGGCIHCEPSRFF